MRKRMLLGLLQYGFALFMIAVTVLYIFAYSNGTLPFMTEEYLSLREKGTLMPSVQAPVEDEADTVLSETAATYANTLDVYNGQGLDKGVYDDDGKHIVRFSMSSIGAIGGSKLTLKWGFVCKTDENGNVRYYDPNRGLEDVTEVLADVSWTFNRDSEGRVLFYGADGYHCYENGKLSACDYDAYNGDKGIAYYPSYQSGHNQSFTVFKADGDELFGLKTADGKIILQAKYKDVYGVSEDRVVAVGTDNKLYIFTSSGESISIGEYFAAESEDESALGCYFYSCGLVRAYTDDGKSVLLKKNGQVFDIPSGFDVCSYSDGLILLKQNYTDVDGKTVSSYGFMSFDGKWICDPDYADARPFYEGLAAVKGNNGLWGMLDTEGNVVIPFVFDSISDCQDGTVIAYAQKYGNYVLGKVSG